jgi:HEAT repeat protein
VLEKDPSSYVRLAVLESLVKTRFKRLPHELSATIFALSKKPTGLADDAIGIILVRSTAMTVLGKTDSSEGHQYLIDELSQKEIDINYLSGIALGVAELGNSAAVATLRTALLTQKGRGYPYYRRVAETLGGVANGEVVGLLREVLKDSDNELSQGICYKIDDNPALKDTNEFAGMVRDFVLDEKGLALDSRMQFLGLLDEVKNDWAKEVLLRIVDTSKSAPIKAAAKKTLDVNFPLKK